MAADIHSLTQRQTEQRQLNRFRKSEREEFVKEWV